MKDIAKEVRKAQLVNDYSRSNTQSRGSVKIKRGNSTLENANYIMSEYMNNYHHRTITKDKVVRAIKNKNIEELREISTEFYNLSGIYARVCKYMARLFKYDWYVVPHTTKIGVQTGADKIKTQFPEVLRYCDNTYIAKMCGEIALKVIKRGCYYGYIIDMGDHMDVQELPPRYCRIRYLKNGMPVVDFDVTYFNRFFDSQLRTNVLKVFPKEFQVAYNEYLKGKLRQEIPSDIPVWFMLDSECAFKITCSGDLADELPPLVNSIPAIIDLEDAQELDKKKMMQKLMKILIQKLPLDNHFDLVFDLEEARDLHSNAVEMLKNAIGVEVLTTFADVSVEDMSDTNTTTKADDLAKVERSVYNSFGVARNLFNSDSNLALEKSILDDEASIRDMLLQLEVVFDKAIKRRFKGNKSFYFSFRMLETTIYNYKEMSKSYKDLTSSGYSKFLPLVALGHSQSEVLAMANFENNMINLTEILIPAMNSNTMNSSKILDKNQQTDEVKNQNNQSDNNKIGEVVDSDKAKGGRPELEDDKKSEKTIANRESM